MPALFAATPQGESLKSLLRRAAHDSAMSIMHVHFMRANIDAEARPEMYAKLPREDQLDGEGHMCDYFRKRCPASSTACCASTRARLSGRRAGHVMATLTWNFWAMKARLPPCKTLHTCHSEWYKMDGGALPRTKPMSWTVSDHLLCQFWAKSRAPHGGKFIQQLH